MDNSIIQSVEIINSRITDISVRLERIEEKLAKAAAAAIRDGEIRVNALENHVTRSKAYLAGVASTFSFIGAGIALAGKYLLTSFTGHPN